MLNVVLIKVALPQAGLRLLKFLEHYHVFLEDSVVLLLSGEVVQRSSFIRGKCPFQFDFSLLYFRRSSSELRWSEMDSFYFLDQLLVLRSYYHVTCLEIKVIIFLSMVSERFQIAAYPMLSLTYVQDFLRR